jgi:hypothetical protein
MTIRETDVENYLVKRAQDVLDAEVYKTVAVGRIGYPDRTILWRRRSGKPGHKLVELKRKGKKASPRQRIEHRRLRRVGQIVPVIDTKAKVDRLIKKLARL